MVTIEHSLCKRLAALDELAERADGKAAEARLGGGEDSKDER